MLKHPNHFQLGKILRTHGLTGNLIATFDTDKPEAYAKLEGILLEKENRLLPHIIKRIIFRGGDILLTLEGITTPEQAALWKGSDIYLPLEKLPKPKKDEFYLHDLVGCTLIDETHGALGEVQSIIETTGQNLISFIYKGNEVLLPFVKEFVTDIDTTSKQIKTKLPDGLLEIYLQETKEERDDALEEEQE